MQQGTAPEYGMAMWFKVVVAGVKGSDLGFWSSCSGLGVTFGTEQVREGGNNDPLFLPGELGYGNITLERAVQRTDSARVQAWLQQVATDWINGPEGGAPQQQGFPVTITVYDNAGQDASQPVATWQLRNAVPVSWSGPTLSAKGGDVAVEKLVLAHRGFLQATEPSEPGKLQLTCGSDKLSFQYNPAKVTLVRKQQITGAKKLTGKTAADQQGGKAELMTIELGDLRIEGQSAVRSSVALLWKWVDPVPDSTGASSSGAKNTTATARQVRVTMGAENDRIELLCVITRVTVDYTRFTSASMPCRAKVSLSLLEVSTPPKEQNPTSAGPPGAHVYTVTEGDTLPNIATEFYGAASAWRQVAARNDIDDPLRVRNGQTLYLPGAVSR